MNLVEDVKPSNMGVVTETKLGGVPGCGQRVHTEFADILRRHWYCIDVCEAIPGGVDFGRRILAVDGWMRRRDEGAITADLHKWNVDLVEDRSFRIVSYENTKRGRELLTVLGTSAKYAIVKWIAQFYEPISTDKKQHCRKAEENNIEGKKEAIVVTGRLPAAQERF